MISSPRENIKQGNEDERDLGDQDRFPGKVMLTLSNKNSVRETEVPESALS